MNIERSRWATALAFGLGASLLLTAATFAGRFLPEVESPFLPELMAQKFFATMTPAWFMRLNRPFVVAASALAALHDWGTWAPALARQVEMAGKPTAFLGMIALYVASLAAVGAAWLRGGQWTLGRTAWGRAAVLGAMIWGATVTILLPALDGGLFGSALPAGPLGASLGLLVGHALYAGALALAASRQEGARAAALAARAPAGRRGFLAQVAASTILALLGSLARRALAAAAAPPAPAKAAQPAFPAVPGLSPEVTPNDLFYTVSKNVFNPTVDVKKWRLEVKGHVDRPYGLTYDELRALPMQSRYVTLECISNEIGGDLVGNALWKGVPLRDFLERAGVRPGAVDCVLRAAEGYSDSFLIAKALHPDTLVAVEMNGVPLPPAHGFPARAVVPGIFGMKNVKWLTAIEVTNYDYKGYWQQRGWSDDARMQTHSRVDVPKTRATVSGDTWVGGIALAGDRGIAKVEVSTDGGKGWLPAQVKKALSPSTWVVWAYQWKASAEPAGRKGASLLVRATDGTGTVQTDKPTPTLPDGATGLHSVDVTLKRP